VNKIRVTEASATTPEPPAPADWQQRIEAARTEGLERARQEITASFESALRDLQVGRIQLEKLSKEWAESMAPHLLDLSLEIAQRLVAYDIADGAIRIEPLVEAAVRELRDAGETDTISIALHPDDYATLHPAPKEGQMAGVQVLADRDVERGACLLRTGVDSFAVTLEARLDEIRRSLDRRAPNPRKPDAEPKQAERAAPECVVESNVDATIDAEFEAIVITDTEELENDGEASA